MIDMGVKWLTPLRLECPGNKTDPGGKLMYLVEDFIVQIGQITCVAPKGLATDGASIPRFFWRAVGSPFTGKYRRAAIFHDAAYKGMLRIMDSEGTEIKERLKRIEADGLFMCLMQADGAGKMLRWTIYRAVRMFGGTAWQGKKE